MAEMNQAEVMGTSNVKPVVVSLSQKVLMEINNHIEDLEQMLEVILVSEPVREAKKEVEAHSALLVGLNGIESRLLSLKSRIDL